MIWMERSEGVDGVTRELITPIGLDVITCDGCAVDAIAVYDVDFE